MVDQIQFYQIYRGMRILEFIRLQRLSWAGHIVKMIDMRLSKRALNSKMQGRIPKARPRKRRREAIDGEGQGLIWTIVPLGREI